MGLVIAHNHDIFNLISKNYKNDEYLISIAFDFSQEELAKYEGKFWDNKVFVLDAASRSAYALYNITNDLSNDRDFILETIKVNPGCIYSCNIKFRTEIDFILEACKINNKVVYYLPKKYLLNEKVKETAYSMKFYDEDWKSYPDEWFDIDCEIDDENFE